MSQEFGRVGSEVLPVPIGIAQLVRHAFLSGMRRTGGLTPSDDYYEAKAWDHYEPPHLLLQRVATHGTHSEFMCSADRAARLADLARDISTRKRQRFITATPEAPQPYKAKTETSGSIKANGWREMKLLRLFLNNRQSVKVLETC